MGELNKLVSYYFFILKMELYHLPHRLLDFSLFGF